MVGRLHLKNLISFDIVNLEFDTGLVVMSGPSGAGKSLLISSVLACLGLDSTEASHCEIELKRPANLTSEQFVLDDIITIKSLKKGKTRYYIDDQNISKKSLQLMFSPYINYLSVRDSGGFESEKLLAILDDAISSDDKSYKKILKEYKKRYANYRVQIDTLSKITNDEKELAQLIEFTQFEVDKISKINPKIGEDQELILVKKQLSKIDKINDALSRADGIFALEGAVREVYELTSQSSAVFSEAMSCLHADFEQAANLKSELEGMDVESLLDRLEQLTDLKTRYGSIEDAILQKEQKELRLLGYKNIQQDKSAITEFIALEQKELDIIARRITQARVQKSTTIASGMQEYLLRLKLPSVKFSFQDVGLMNNGSDLVVMELSGSNTATLSGGEHNRLRLALLVVSLQNFKSGNGIIILDEIDANVSGDESIAIAQMISKLSSHYQIFAISHQPHLSAKANQHILIDKQDGISRATILDNPGRINEISRIIAGEERNDEASAFAKKLLKEKS